MPRIAMRPTSLEDLGIARKPFYTTAEVARILQISDQSLLDRIHTPADDERHVYAVALGPRTYRIPVGALAQLVGIQPKLRIGSKPRRIDEIVRREATTKRRSR